MINLEQRLSYNYNIKAHLEQLSHLTNRAVTKHDLLSLELTDSIREQSLKLLNESRSIKFEIYFLEKTEARFQAFVKNLVVLNPSPVYVWIEHTITCGLLEIALITEFNFKFEYSVCANGIISLLTKDMMDNLVLDFYEDSLGERVIDIELIGNNWPSCSY